MKQELGVEPVITQLPLGTGKEFHGVVDLLHMHALIWQREMKESSFSCVTLDSLPQDLQRSAHHYRELLLEQVSMPSETAVYTTMCRWQWRMMKWLMCY